MMEPKLVLLTGATDGIGRQTALELLKRGFKVLVHGRNLKKAQSACEDLRQEASSDQCVPVAADLSSLRQVRDLAAAVLRDHERIDVLLNNAGVFRHDHQLSGDGFELTLAVNHLAPFVLTHLLLPALRRAPAGRIVNVSSMAHQRGQMDARHLDDIQKQRGYDAYATSKLANVLFTAELARRLGPGPLTVNALHPGVISTKLLREGFGAGGADLEEGAAAELHLATDPSLAQVTGRYFSGSRPATPSKLSQDADLQRRFYEWSAALTGITPDTTP